MLKYVMIFPGSENTSHLKDKNYEVDIKWLVH